MEREHKLVIAPSIVLSALLTEFLYAVHPWLAGVTFFGVIMAVTEGGFRLGRRSNLEDSKNTQGRIMAVGAGLLGILGLLLAFSLAMAVSRYDARRVLVVEETNAIGTAYLRTYLIPPPEGPELAGLLREYLDAKIHFFDAGFDRDRLLAARRGTEQLQKELWSRAAVSAQKDPRSIPAGLMLQSLNQAFDLENSRWIALTVHVPVGVLWTDILVAGMAVLLMGYNFGVAGPRHLASTGLLALCIATVLTVILDLDQPRRGLIQVGQQTLIDLQKDLEGK